jgi:hypothetical protein
MNKIVTSTPSSYCTFTKNTLSTILDYQQTRDMRHAPIPQGGQPTQVQPRQETKHVPMRDARTLCRRLILI